MCERPREKQKRRRLDWVSVRKTKRILPTFRIGRKVRKRKNKAVYGTQRAKHLRREKEYAPEAPQPSNSRIDITALYPTQSVSRLVPKDLWTASSSGIAPIDSLCPLLTFDAYFFLFVILPIPQLPTFRRISAIPCA